MKMHTHSYCCLDYAQIYDIVRYRIHKMRLKLKSELEDRNTIQEYICTSYGKRYNAFDALRLMSTHDDSFHCESCNSELVAESDKIGAEEMADGDDNAKRRRQEKLKDMLQKMEEQLKPLTNQINVLKGLSIPEFGSLQAWESRVHAVTRGDPESNLTDPLKLSQGHGGTPMPFLGETKSHRESNTSTVEERPKRDARHAGNVVGKCKILSWQKQVVAEGTVVSTDPDCLVHFKKLGPDGCKVWVDVAVDPEVFLWRPSSEMCTIGEAVGSTVAWHKDFVAFD